MPRFFKVIIKWIVGTIIGICVLYYLIYLIIDVNNTRLRLLKEQGKLPPPRKKVKQYFEEEPENIDYDKSSLIPIEETEMYKEAYKDKDPKLDLEKTRSDGIWICIILWIIIFYMLYKIYYKL